MKVVYVGPSTTGVVIAETGQQADVGTPIEVSDKLGASLLEQDIWQSADAEAKPASKVED